MATPNWHHVHLWQVQFVRDAIVVAGIVFVLLAGYWLRAVTVPLLVALALAYLFEPVVDRATERFGLSRDFVVTSIIGLLGILLLTIVLVGVPLVIVQTTNLVRSLPAMSETVIDRLEDFEDDLLELLPLAAPDEDEAEADAADDPLANGEGDGLAEAIVDPGGADNGAGADANEGESEADAGSGNGSGNGSASDSEDPAPLLRRFTTYVRANIGPITQQTITTSADAVRVIADLAGSTIYLGFVLFLVPFYFFFFSRSYAALQEFFVATIPEDHHPRLYDILRKMDAAVAGFIRGRLVISLIMGILLSIGWGICGVPYWFIIGMTTGVFCAVPYLGGVGIPAAIIALWIAETDAGADAMPLWGIVLWPSLVFAIVQLIEGYVLIPLIAGRTTGLSPVTILVAVLAGGTAMGFYGMLVAIPTAACLKIMIVELLLPRVREWASGQAADILPFGRREP